MATAQQPLSPEVHHLTRKPLELDAQPIPATEAALVLSGPAHLALQRAPEVVLQEAAKAAQALREVIEQKPNKCVINVKTFLQFEDWQTLGRFCGVTAAARTTKRSAPMARSSPLLTPSHANAQQASAVIEFVRNWFADPERVVVLTKQENRGRVSTVMLLRRVGRCNP